MSNIVTATTPSKVRTNLTSLLEDVTTKNAEIHIILSSGKNAVLISEDELNSLRSQLSEMELMDAKKERIAYLKDPSTKKYNTAEEMHQDILGDLYDELPD